MQQEGGGGAVDNNKTCDTVETLCLIFYQRIVCKVNSTGQSRNIIHDTEENNTGVGRQNTLTLSLEVVEESGFSDTAYKSAYISDVQNLIAILKVPCMQQIFG